MVRFNRLLTISLLVALLLSACQPIRLPPTLWPQNAPPQNLTWVAHLGGPALAIVVQGRYAYVGFPAEVAVFDLADPAHPVRRGYLPLGAADLVVDGDYLYASSRYGLWIMAITQPTQPAPLGYLPLTGVTALAVQAPYLYLADGAGHLYVIDGRDPAAPRQLAYLDLFAPIAEILVADHYLYAATTEGLTIVDVAANVTVDVTVAPSPTIVGRLALSGTPQTLALVAGYLYLQSADGLNIVDIGDPAQPTRMAVLDLQGLLMKIVPIGQYAYVADGPRGLHVLDISDPRQPVAVGVLPITGFVSDLVSRADYLYLTDSNGGLHIVQLTTPQEPHYLTKVNLPGVVRNLALAEDTAYVVSSPFWGDAFGVTAVDVTNPAQPIPAAAKQALGEVWHIALGDHCVYLPAWNAGLYLVNLVNPRLTDQPTEQPTFVPFTGALHDVVLTDHIGVVTDAGGGLYLIDTHEPKVAPLIGAYRLTNATAAWDLAVRDGYAYLVTGADGLQIVNLQEPTHLNRVGALDTPGRAQGIALSEHYAIIADGQAGLRVIDIANPSLLRAVGSITLPGEAVAVTAQDGYAFVAAGEAGVYVVDVRQPPALELVGAFDTAGSANAVVVAKDLVYVADQHGGLWILRFTPPTRAGG